MGNSLLDPPPEHTVALVRWSKAPGDNPVIKFVLFSILGLILCLFLMIFIPGLRSFGALAMFTGFVAALFTVPAISGRKKFMRGLTKRVNATVAEVTDAPGDQLSVREFQQMVRSGERRPLLVGGVPGLTLHVERISTLEKDAPNKWLAVFSVVPPENGTESFDRLVSAAMEADPGARSTGAL